MLIDIRKVGFVNKGSELMLHAVLQKMQERYPEARFSVAPRYRECGGREQYLKRSELGLFQKAWLWAYGVQFGNLAHLMPTRLRNMYGIVLDSEVDVVLDASGFSYGEQWGIKSCRELSTSVKQWRKQGTKVILLPQALGPYQSRKMIAAIKLVADNVDLIFAREQVSYQYLVDIVGERENIKIAPDFTNLVKGYLPSHFNTRANRFCVMPNYRMIDKTPHEVSNNYVSFLAKCIDYLIEKNITPFILIHEGKNDQMLASKIVGEVGRPIPVVQEPDPLKVKGILGACDGVIGSRFHGLVSALSQGVPALATSWSHKYQLLFDDYGFSDGIIEVTADFEEIKVQIDLITEEDTKSVIQKKVMDNSVKLKEASEAMWHDVFRLIEH